MRVGTGYDVHRYGEGDHVLLAGVRIPHTHGVVAHSDGDVLIHAVMDALLGALALGDLGQHFPDDDERYRDASSRELLRRVMELVRAQGYVLGNLDSTIIAETPRLAALVPAMRANLAEDLACDPGAVSVKATTHEGLGALGRGEGLAVQALVLLRSD